MHCGTLLQPMSTKVLLRDGDSPANTHKRSQHIETWSKVANGTSAGPLQEVGSHDGTRPATAEMGKLTIRQSFQQIP